MSLDARGVARFGAGPIRAGSEDAATVSCSASPLKIISCAVGHVQGRLGRGGPCHGRGAAVKAGRVRRQIWRGLRCAARNGGPAGNKDTGPLGRRPAAGGEKGLR